MHQVGKVILTMLADGLLLVVWGVIQWGVNSLIMLLHLSAVFDRVMLWIFQAMFALSTLSAVFFYIVVDIREGWRRFRS